MKNTHFFTRMAFLSLTLSMAGSTFCGWTLRVTNKTPYPVTGTVVNVLCQDDPYTLQSGESVDIPMKDCLVRKVTGKVLRSAGSAVFSLIEEDVEASPYDAPLGYRGSSPIEIHGPYPAWEGSTYKIGRLVDGYLIQ